jgi:hypothetical protein
MAQYQGHKNWNHWNVSLWIMNEYNVYKWAAYLVTRYNRDVAARKLLAYCKVYWREFHGCTPDDAPLTFSSVRAALTNWGK